MIHRLLAHHANSLSLSRNPSFVQTKLGFVRIMLKNVR